MQMFVGNKTEGALKNVATSREKRWKYSGPT